MVAVTIQPVMNVITQSIHNLILAFATWTPGNWFLRVFAMMGGFVTNTGANIRTVVIDLWTHFSPMQKTVGASFGVVCYFRNAVESITIAWISHKTEIVKAEVKSTVDLAAMPRSRKQRFRMLHAWPCFKKSSVFYNGFLKAHSSNGCSLLCSVCSSRPVLITCVKGKGTRPKQISGRTPFKSNVWI